MLHNKKADVPKTITWVIATVVIIVILVFSIFIASFIKRNKEFDLVQHRDLLLAKSISGFLLTSDDTGEKVFEQIFEEGDLNDFNGPLGVAIFKNYERIFLELKTKPVSIEWPGPSLNYVQKEYFNRLHSISPKHEEFNLGENKYLIFDIGI